jgi:hypothetical protein
MAKRTTQAADEDWDSDGAPAAAPVAAGVADGVAKPEPKAQPAPAVSCALPTCLVPPSAILEQFQAAQSGQDAQVLASLSTRYPAVKRLLAEVAELRAKAGQSGAR